jgi:K(+)-stimulated pyrophosphate-energized sodium pump
VLVGLFFYRYINRQDSGTERMREISGLIKEGAAAFIRREYTVLAIFITVVAVLIAVFLPQPLWESHNLLLNIQLPGAYGIP